MKWRAMGALAVGLALVMAGGSTAARDGIVKRAVGIPGRANANPSMAARGAFVAVVWAAASAEGVTDIYAATSRDSGRTFGDPSRVNDVPGDAKISGEQPPRVALVPRTGAQPTEPAVVVVWTAKGGRGTRLLSARSVDGGKSFARAVVVPGGDGAGNRGWESTATDRDGHVLAIWLDHRDMAAASRSAAPMHHDGEPHAGHGSADGAAQAQLSKLYVSRIDGEGEGSGRAIAAGVCYCCKTALAVAADGSVYAAWRHVYPGNVRDIAFTLSRDGGRTFAAPIRVSEDQWALDGCPENGPAIAVDVHDTVHIVWPTLVNGGSGVPTESTGGMAAADDPTLALFYAATRDGRRFSARQRIHTEGVPRHPQIAVGADGSLLVAWDEGANGSRRVVAAEGVPDRHGALHLTRLAPVGQESDPDSHPEINADRGEYPAVVAVDRGFVLAWTSGPPTNSVIRIAHIPRR